MLVRSGLNDSSQRERERSNSIVSTYASKSSSNKLDSNSRAQGTIEYLVIIAIVVVIGLVVVGLVLTQTQSSTQISSTASKINRASASIGITESLVDPQDGNFVVRLLNNSGENITISNVRIGDTNVNFSEDLAQGGSRFFRIQLSGTCETGKVVSEMVVITYVNEYGLTKVQRLNDPVLFDCTPYTIAQANLANQCPDVGGSSCILTGNATEGDVLSGKTFYSNNSNNKLTGSYVAPSVPSKYASFGTGQTGCWDVSGSSRSCSGTGEDAAIYGSSYAHVWRDNGDGTVSDLNSGLMWQKSHTGGTLVWQGALDYCKGLSLGGYSDWHLPAFGELWQMYDYRNGTCFSVFNGCNYYWSSTSVPSAPNSAYYLGYYGYGYVVGGPKSSVSGVYARCVRFEN